MVTAVVHHIRGRESGIPLPIRNQILRQREPPQEPQTLIIWIGNVRLVEDKLAPPPVLLAPDQILRPRKPQEQRTVIIGIVAGVIRSIEERWTSDIPLRTPNLI